MLVKIQVSHAILPKQMKILPLLLFLSFLWPINSSIAQEGLWVESVVASQTTMVPFIQANGTLVPIWKADLAGTHGGRIAKIYGSPGDTLASGSVAWVFDDGDFALSLKASEKALAVVKLQWEELKAGAREEEIERLSALKRQAEAFLSQIQNERKRVEKLFVQEVIPSAQREDIGFKEQMAESQLAATRSALKAAKAGPTQHQLAVVAAQVEQAKAALNQAKKLLDDCVVKTPRQCKIVSRIRDEGEIVSPAEPVLKLVAINPIKVRFYVSDSDIQKINFGQSLWVKVTATGESIQATLSAIIPQCDEVNRRVPCEALLQNLYEKIIPGQPAEISIPLPFKTGIAVPSTAIIDTTKGRAVFVVENGHVRLFPITELAKQENISLIEGIPPNCRVISRGAMGLQDGAAVNDSRK
ncbi:efflux RND transporter periplasmic adaptor subunit [bacterium]|nr:efflux RND transporter periplasmic adaptor subunit [bacterium]